MAGDSFDHLRIGDNYRSQETYVPRSGGGDNGKELPNPDRNFHGAHVTRRFDEAWESASDRSTVTHATRHGVYLEFRGASERGLPIKPLEDLKSKKVRVLNVRTQEQPDGNDATLVTVYVADDHRKYLAQKLEDYFDPAKDKRNEEKQTSTPANASLVNAIDDILDAVRVDAFWTDSPDVMPGDDPANVEVWLRCDEDEFPAERDAPEEQRLRNVCESLGIGVEEGRIHFPERLVKVVRANYSQLSELTKNSDDIAEYRRAKDTAAFILEMDASEQTEWMGALEDRLFLRDDVKTRVCIIDTGVNAGHPLLTHVLDDQDCMTVAPEWSVADQDGHGTLMAGVAAYGDLDNALKDTAPYELSHRLESVKLIEKSGEGHSRHLWGYLTSQAVSLAEINKSDVNRVICMAVTSTDTRDKGKPSSWSGAIDQMIFGESEDSQRLFLVAAGNVPVEKWQRYPDAQIEELIHDPAQSWNALTVGAYTGLDELTHPMLKSYTPLAPAGGLSPFSSTSSKWDEEWPLKPDVVFEGGNLAFDGKSYVEQAEDFCVVSTHHEYIDYPLKGFNMTSAATAQAAWTAAKIRAGYPEFWPETIRGLMVHSARWTKAMHEQFIPSHPNKEHWKNLIRICGWGVPSLQAALYSAQDSLTLIREAELQPFKKGGGLNQIDYYELPWPVDVLRGLPAETNVMMRVTLSYYVEPSPGEIGWKDRYRYASHALRFKMKNPLEKFTSFKRRLNKKLDEGHDDKYEKSSDSDFWRVGSEARHHGTIHSDIWEGSPQELADSNGLAVYPVKGWWAERTHLGRAENKCRYSLIVSIYTEEQEVDLYTPVLNMINVPVSIDT
ncbi:S8 family peptidase [Verrucomicrobiaceae bacterium R5-34]|nr:S8 family peptidase [Verrucomicrobiaceae bacterium R5-34]